MSKRQIESRNNDKTMVTALLFIIMIYSLFIKSQIL